MSLRARLALLYTSIVGGILFLFGMAVYMTVSLALTTQVDERLGLAARKVSESIRGGDVSILQYAELDAFNDIYVQIWNRGQVLRSSSQNISGFNKPLDPSMLLSGVPVYQTVEMNTRSMRVLTVPLAYISSNRVVSVMQVGTSLTTVNTTMRVLLIVLFIGAAISMFIAGLAGWVSTNQALAPLEVVTQIAQQITRADDLSRRLPYQGPPNDEIGQLISAFNQTLSRLENLFNTQRRFLTDVGHELRTPLTVIKGNVDLMHHMNSMDEESLGSIESEVDRLTRLVGDLLLLAQAESGKLPLARELVEMDSLVLEVMNQMRVLAKDRRMRLGEIDQVLVYGDQDRLKQVLVNLIGNALKYTPAGSEVVIGVGKAENRARITVSDNGPGIPAKDLPHIFERFYRGEKSRTRSREGKGFGLGLSIAYWIVRNHDGQIEVSSKEASGSTFCIWLPLAEKSAPDGAKKVP